MARKPKAKEPARQPDSAKDDDKKPRGKPVSLFPMSFEEAMKKLVKSTTADDSRTTKPTTN